MAGLWLAFACLVARGEGVSREPPKIYGEVLSKLLTPAEEALKQRDAFPETDAPGVVLVDEAVRYVDETGRVFTAFHRIRLPRTEPGVQQVSKDIHTFHKSDQKIHLVLARTIQPDGTSQPVSADGVFIQSPQDEAEYSLYSDMAELVVIFPNVKPRTAIESITVVEDLEARIQGEYTGMAYFGASWPQVKDRTVVDLPGAFASRLTIATLGQGVPEVKRESPSAGRVRLTWVAEKTPAAPWEPGQAPPDQTGPMVTMSTLKDWNAFAAWYNQWLRARDPLKPGLAARVDEWTKDAKEPRQILEILFAKVAREVRYTGLEFGRGRFQPHDPNEVWTNQYGDCKDKSNLLRVMLAHKKIPAHMVLLNTEHAGSVEKRTPDFRRFNHAILAVPQPDGKLLFCDPTIAYAKPGLISPDDADRDVLVIKDNGAEFVRTPPQDGGMVRYGFDLKKALNGELTGWLTLDADGFQGAMYAEHFTATDRAQTRDHVLGIVRDFFPGAEVVDVEAKPKEPWAGAYQLRAFFMVSGGGHEGSEIQTLAFPMDRDLFPSLGDRKERRTLYFQHRGVREMKCRIQLPTGWTAAATPRPFQLDIAPASFDARWDAKGPEILASLQYRTKQDVVTADQFKLFHAGITSFQAWMNKPLALSTSGAPTSTEPPKTVDLSDFPMMPSGEGQMALVDRRYPADTSPKLRREALQRTLQWFPNDKTTRFIASIRLAELDLLEDTKKKAPLDQARKILQSAKGDLGPEHYSWGEYMFALMLHEAGQDEEGLAILTRIAADTALTGYRRGWSAVEAANQLKEKSPDRAITILRGTIGLDSSAVPAEYALMAGLLLRQGKGAELQTMLEAEVGKKAQTADQVFGAIFDEVDELLTDGHRDEAAALVTILEKVISQHVTLAHLAEQLKPRRDNISAFGAYQQLAAEIQKHFSTQPPDWWAKTTVSDSLKTREQFVEAVEEHNNAGSLDAYFRHSIEVLLRFPPDPEDFPQRIWTIANAMESHDRDEVLLTRFLDWCDRIPDSSAWFYEGKFTRARRLQKQNKGADAVAVYDLVCNQAKVTPTIAAAAWRLRGESLESQKKYKEALASWKHLEKEPDVNFRSYNALLRAIFINLESGDRAEALRLIPILGGADRETSEKLASPVQVHAFTEILKSGEHESYWKNSDAWWPAWLALRAKLGMPPVDPVSVPIIPDAMQLGVEMGRSFREKDKNAYFRDLGRMMHAARWIPSSLIDASGMLIFSCRVSPQNQRELRDLVIAMNRDVALKDEDLMRRSRLELAAAYADNARVAEALAIVHAFLEKSKVEDEITESMLTLWGFLAAQQNKEIAEAAKAIEARLSSGQNLAKRAMLVDALAKVYHRAGRGQDERNLLTKEVENPDTATNPEHLAGLKARLAALSRDGNDATQFSQAVGDWLKTRKPAWYDFAGPQNLDDPRLKDVDAFLKNPPRDLLPGERAKAGLLIAQSPLETPEHQTQALEMALFEMGAFCRRHDELRDLFLPLINDARVDEETRARWLWYHIVDIFPFDQDVSPWAKHAVAARFNDGQKLFIEHAAEFQKLDRRSAVEMEKYAMRVLDQPVNPPDIIILRRAFQRILMRADFESAQRVLARLDSISFTSDQHVQPARLKLDFLKLLNAHRDNHPTHKAMREIMLARHAGKTLPPPSDWANRRLDMELDDLDQATATQARLHILQESPGRILPGDFWLKLIHAMPPSPARDKLALELLKASVSQAPDDMRRSAYAMIGMSMLDEDDPVQRQAMFDALKPWRDPEKNPMTSSVIRLFEVHVAMRTGGKFDPATDLQNLKHPLVRQMEPAMKLQHYLLTNDSAQLKLALQGMPVEALLDPQNLECVLPALAAVGMKDELQLAQQTARDELRKAVLRAWCTLDPRQFSTVFNLAGALHATDPYPRAWVEDCLKKIKNTDSSRFLQLRDAGVHQDWNTVLAASNDLLAIHPTRYGLYWYKGRALHHLKRKPEAAEALRTYTRFCKDDIEYPEALDLLKQTEAK